MCVVMTQEGILFQIKIEPAAALQKLPYKCINGDLGVLYTQRMMGKCWLTHFIQNILLCASGVWCHCIFVINEGRSFISVGEFRLFMSHFSYKAIDCIKSLKCPEAEENVRSSVQIHYTSKKGASSCKCFRTKG